MLSETECDHKGLARRLGLAAASTSYHLRLLSEAGFVHVRSMGRQRFYSLTDPAHVESMPARFPPVPEDLDMFEAVWTDLFG